MAVVLGSIVLGGSCPGRDCLGLGDLTLTMDF